MLLNEKLKPYKIILASGSPRRRQLIADCGINYELATGYDVEELFPDSMPAELVPVFLARLKSDAYPAQLAQNEIIITADTVVIQDGKVLGKPKDRDDAVAMISALSGRVHRVVTGVVLRSADKTVAFSAHTDVWFRVLRAEEIEFYIDTYKPYDKAGSYGIQEWIGYAAIERIEGSFYNVMGLPIQMLYVNLEKFIETRL